ncbi:MAG: hypothetical protein DSY89_02230 [Deltaproteobacteria bacterium]|nr:MAG: hypothetical protein DSY89_02230 [Deltaproteobacteria bacterium]
MPLTLELMSERVGSPLSNDDLSPALAYFHKKYHLPAVQLVKNLRHERLEDDIVIRSMFRFLGGLTI